MGAVKTGSVLLAAVGIIVAQVILPAALDLLGSVALIGIGAALGMKLGRHSN